jgi:hypothetical protein
MGRSRSPALCAIAWLVSACSSGGSATPTDAGGVVIDVTSEGQGGTQPDATGDAMGDATVDAITDAGVDSTTEAGDAPAEGNAVVVDAGSGSDASADSSQDALEAGDAAGTLASLAVSTGTLKPPFSPQTTDYYISSLNDVYPITVTATVADGGALLTIHGADAASGVPSTFSLSPGEDIAVRAGAVTYTVHYMPPDLPGYHVATTGDAGTEDLLLTASVQYQMIVDRSGGLRYYRTFMPQHQVLDFQPFTMPDGSTEYGSLVGNAPYVGSIEGYEHVIDSHFNDLGDLQLVAGDAESVLAAEAHDFLLLDDDRYVAMAYVQRTVDLSKLNASWSSSALVIHNVVQEVVAGASVFEWDSRDVPSLYSDSTNSGQYNATTATDYLHLNSICIDPRDGNFVLSFRNTSSIVKLDRHTGQILWTLGGKSDQFGLTGNQIFKLQHFVRVQPDGSIWVFDNGNPGTATRVVSYVLNETSKTLVSFTDQYDKPSSEPQSFIMGSYAPMSPTRTIYGWGAWMNGQPGPDVTEVSNGSVVWSLTFADAGTFSYRALPIPAL